MAYDLLIKGGRVVDPAQEVDGILDLAIAGDRVAALARDVPSIEARQVTDATGLLVTPGLIDTHCHVYTALTKIGAAADDAGVNQAVTTVVDAGSAGEATFGGFSRYVVGASRTTVLCFLHIDSFGLSRMPELMNLEEIDPESTAALVESNRGVIKGIKLRLLGRAVAERGARVLEIAKKTARDLRLPIMVHVGDFDKKVARTLTADCLTLLDNGDIISHVYTPQWGAPIDSRGNVLPELNSAIRRGVGMDVAPGIFNFSFETARKGIASRVLPTAIGSDVTVRSLNERVYGLTVTMSKMMALGMSLNQVVEKSTSAAARILGMEDRIGSLKPGMQAEVTR